MGRKAEGDSPEMIKACLSCPKRECTNCFAPKRKRKRRKKNERLPDKSN